MSSNTGSISKSRDSRKRVVERQPQQLRAIAAQHGLSVSAGHIQLLEGNWYITHAGLLRLAIKNRCSGIHTEPVAEFCDPAATRWVMKAIVFKSPRSKGFVGYGDADPTNVSPLVRGAEMRVAETRAVNRALRKAYGVGTCSVEELGATLKPQPVLQSTERTDNAEGQVRLRDRLLLLIRKHRLDAEQVKRYAADFCGTAALRAASREQVQQLVNHLERTATEGHDRLLAELESTAGAPVQAAPTEQHAKEPNKEAA